MVGRKRERVLVGFRPSRYLRINPLPIHGRYGQYLAFRMILALQKTIFLKNDFPKFTTMTTLACNLLFDTSSIPLRRLAPLKLNQSSLLTSTKRVRERFQT